MRLFPIILVLTAAVRAAEAGESLSRRDWGGAWEGVAVCALCLLLWRHETKPRCERCDEEAR